jgi:arylsulfatase A-like enzyme
MVDICLFLGRILTPSCKVNCYFEGGIHVPFFVKWPAGLPRGKIYSKPVAQVDIFATAAAAAGDQCGS